MMSHTHIKIADLRQQSVQKVLESILGLVAALYTTLILPQLLLRYVYADQQLTAEPRTLELIPVVTFGLAIAYMLYAAISNISRSKEIKKLLAQAEQSGCDCGCDNDMSDAELAELEAMVEDVLQEDDTSSMAKAMTGKKAKKSKKVSKK